MNKNEIAAALRETGLLLKAKGENAFKAKAYVTGARALEGFPDEINLLVKEDRLTDLPGIGTSLARYIAEFHEHGETKLLNSLRAELPRGTAELSQIDGLTLKRIKALSEELEISSIKDLEQACKGGKVASLKGFGLKTQNALLEAIASFGNSENALLLIDAFDIANELVSFLRAALNTKNVQTVGTVKRWHEAISTISIVAEGEIADVLRVLKGFHGVTSTSVSENAAPADNGGTVASRSKFDSETKLDSGIRVASESTVARSSSLASVGSVKGILAAGGTIEVFTTQNFPLALVAHTGTDKHFEQLQHIAKQRGLELTPTALKSHSKKIDVHSEHDVFKNLRLNYIPPELREGENEVVLAEDNDFSDLIDIKDIRGMTHCHSTFSDGRHTIEQMALAAQNMGMEYITLTDHSPTAHYAGGLEIDRLKEQWEEVDRVQELVKIKILKGTECDILSDGKLDYPDHILDKFDIVIASIHSRYKQDEEQMTKRLLAGLRNPHFKIWGHPLGRLVLRRDPIPCNVPKLLEAIADARVAIEINGDPYRLDLEPKWASIARQLGLKFVISTDAHAIGDLKNLKYGIHMARRAQLKKSDVLNALPVSNFAHVVKAK
jgi:DNA polymerase (family X)